MIAFSLLASRTVRTIHGIAISDRYTSLHSLPALEKTCPHVSQTYPPVHCSVVELQDAALYSLGLGSLSTSEVVWALASLGGM